jgi:three-Cys-motif partner protein
MTKPTGILWKADRHTLAKHAILKAYLDAWIPILSRARNADQLAMIDGFAGPGAYVDGEKGSPMLMLDCYLRRQDRERLQAKRLRYFFVEENKGRAEHLQGLVDARTLPANVEVEVRHGRYEDEMPALLDQLERENAGVLPPTFAFVDPFGYEANRFELASRLVGFDRCEVLVYVPIAWIARFVGKAENEPALCALFGDRSWEPAKSIEGLDERERFLHDCFKSRLEAGCGYVRSFEIAPERAHTGYHLFFGTNSEKGLARMKTAMWKIDPVRGQFFRDSTVVDHPVLFETDPDLGPLLELLQERFGDRVFTIEQAEHFTLVETPYLHDSHLKRRTLGVVEKAGGLVVVQAADGKRKRRPGEYPQGTRMVFKVPVPAPVEGSARVS